MAVLEYIHKNLSPKLLNWLLPEPLFASLAADSKNFIT